MSLSSHYRSLLKAVTQYEDLLNEVSEETFLENPASGGWSYSETFSHIFQSNLASLVAVEKCYLGTGVYDRKSLGMVVWAILFFGTLPPGKFKAPERIASMVKRISKEEAKNLIIKFRNRLEDLRHKIPKADPHQKVKHPRLNLLNARQWLRFIEIHTIHHTKQLERIRKSLKS